MKVKVRKLFEDAKLPTYETDKAAGMDVYAHEDKYILSKSSQIFSTGLSFELPEGWELQVRGRSGLSFKNDVIPHWGTLDEDYRGELKIKLFNLSNTEYHIHKGDRIAQILIKKVERIELEEVTELSETSRGEGGFGSTGR